MAASLSEARYGALAETKGDASVISSSLSPPPTTIALVVNLVVYSALAIFALASSRKELRRLSSVPRSLALAAVLRMVWMGAEYLGWGEAGECRDAKGLVSFCGRLSAVLFVSAFSSVLFFWWDVLLAPPHSEIPEGTEKMSFCQPRTADILLKFWVFVILAGLFIYKFFTCDDEVRQDVADAEILAIAFTYGILAIGYAAIGSGIRFKLLEKESISSTQLRRRIEIITLTCVIFFFQRSFLFLIYPLFGIELKGALRSWTYPWFFYTVPEVIPSFVLLALLMRRRKVTVALEDAMLIAPLEHENASENSFRIFRV